MNAKTEPIWTLAQANETLTAFRSFQSSNAYQYRPLAEGELRLLKITLPAADGSMPRLELEHTALDSAPPFDALSYCWGSDSRPYKAPIDTRAGEGAREQAEPPYVSLTESLAEMLAYLPRHCMSPDHTTSYVWIDQLCINQSGEGKTEKTHQIRLMKDIYTKATQVLIWLGPGPDPATAQSIADILGCSKGAGDRRLKLWEGSQPSEDAISIRYIWENPWFSRSWVVQESGLAKNRQPLIGLHPVDWQSITQAATSAHTARYQHVETAIFQHVMAVFIWDTFQLRSNDSDIFRGILFCSFLAMLGQYLQAGDPRDKILAFMGLWQPRSFDILSTAEESYSQVYTRLARSLVKDTRRLDVLAAVRPIPLPMVGEGTIGESSQPSWVPRWDMLDTHLAHSPFMAAPFRTQASTFRWRASSPHDEHVYAPPEDSTLRTRGEIICSVNQVFSPITNKMFEPKGALEQTQQSRFSLAELQAALHFEEHSITLQDAVRIFIECSQLGRDIEQVQAELLELLVQFQSAVDQALPTEGILEQVFRKFQDARSLYRPQGRRLFTTAWPDGTQTRNGLGPRFTQKEDKVAILHGARFPVILRRVGGESQKYYVVGDCYVDGIMYGEAVDWEAEDAEDILLI